MNLGEIAPRDLPNGVKYLGHLNDPSLDMYVLWRGPTTTTGTNPDAPETKPLIPDNMIILISSRPNYMMAYGCLHLHRGRIRPVGDLPDQPRPAAAMWSIIPTAAWWSCRRTRCPSPTRWIAGWWRPCADMALFELKQEYSGAEGAAPPLTFKDCAAADIDAAFFEQDEHADWHTVDGKDALVIVDDQRLKEHSAALGGGSQAELRHGTVYGLHGAVYPRERLRAKAESRQASCSGQGDKPAAVVYHPQLRGGGGRLYRISMERTRQ